VRERFARGRLQGFDEVSQVRIREHVRVLAHGPPSTKCSSGGAFARWSRSAESVSGRTQ
jgi:hypothetical protein